MKQNNYFHPKFASHKKMITFINGKFVKSKDAKISIYDLGFTNGEMIYDTFRTFNKKPFHVDLHLTRLWETSKYTGIKKEILSIKGKTNEGIGFLGRKEGIAVISTTTIKIKNTLN